jgi:hypothetical protein
MSDIGITMLGSSGSGKTCYMLAMYAVMSTGIRGFTFTTQDPDDDLDLADDWERLEVNGTWPDPTTQSKNWLFDCSYGFKKIKGFKWHDYRGGALTDRSKPDDRKVLRQKFNNSSCIILCISGEVLMNFIQGSCGKPKEVGQFNSFMNKFRNEMGKTVPVVIAITKSDLCGDILEKGVEVIKGWVNALFAPGSGWLTMICPVSLGTGSQDNFEVYPENVHLPVTFAIFHALQKDINDTLSAIKANKRQVMNKQFEVSQLGENWFKALWNKGDIADEQYAIESLQRSTGLKEADCRTLQRNLELLKNELLGENLYMYHNGRRFAL